MWFMKFYNKSINKDTVKVSIDSKCEYFHRFKPTLKTDTVIIPVLHSLSKTKKNKSQD